jgi:hypothetical protein
LGLFAFGLRLGLLGVFAFEDDGVIVGVLDLLICLLIHL